MTAVLWHIEVSHYNEKARWALDYKGVPHELRTPMPGLHRARALMLTRGAHDRLPVLQLEGRTIGDSTAIIAALEECQPDPPLYPADAGERERALALEDYFDEELAPRLRRFVWHHTLDDTEATVDAVLKNAGPFRRGVMRAGAPLARPLVRRDFNASEATAAEAVEGMRAAMDRLESEIGPSGYLVGDSFTVADLTAAALFTPLLAPPGRPFLPDTVAPPVMEVREELSAREGGAFVAEMYARHRGRSAAIPAG
jgi:glutathione S-transferase